MSPRHTWEQTVMCRKQFLMDQSISYPSLNKQEDKAFVRDLVKANSLVPVINPNLYIYCYNGKNTCDNAHFEMLFGYAQKLSEDQKHLIGQVFECELNPEQGSNALTGSAFMSSLRYVWDVPPGRH